MFSGIWLIWTGTRVLPPEPAFSHGASQDVKQGGLRGVIGKTTKMDPDPNAPRDPLVSDPSNYGSKVTNPTHTGKQILLTSHSNRPDTEVGLNAGSIFIRDGVWVFYQLNVFNRATFWVGGMGFISWMYLIGQRLGFVGRIYLRWV